MKLAWSFIIPAMLIIGCASETDETPNAVPERPKAGIQLPLIDDNLFHDTLLIHETFAMPNGTFFMSARNNEELDSNQLDPGLRLYNYRLKADSTPEILSYSNPAYDSWMMRPSFFEHPSGGYLILAEFGSTESWGQKVMVYNNEFTDLGFLDVAITEVKKFAEIDSSYIGRSSIAPFVKVDYTDGHPNITFTSDSVFVYDDLRGQFDTSYLAKDIRYITEDGKLVLEASIPE